MKKLMLSLFSVVLVMLCVNSVQALSVDDVVSAYQKSAEFKKLDNGKVTYKDGVITITHGTNGKIVMPVGSDGVLDFYATDTDYEIVKGFVEVALKAQGYTDKDIQKIYTSNYTYEKNGVQIKKADKNVTYFADKIKSIVKSDNHLFYHDSSLTNGAGDNSYRYSGDFYEVNNWVQFGNASQKSSDGYCTSDWYYSVPYVSSENQVQACVNGTLEAEHGSPYVHDGDHDNVPEYKCENKVMTVYVAEGHGVVILDLPSDATDVQAIEGQVFASDEDFANSYNRKYNTIAPANGYNNFDMGNKALEPTTAKKVSLSSTDVTPNYNIAAEKDSTTGKYVFKFTSTIKGYSSAQETYPMEYEDGSIHDKYMVPVKFKVKYKSSTCSNNENDLYRVVGVFGNKVKLIKARAADKTLLGDNGEYDSSTTAADVYGKYFWNKSNKQSYDGTDYWNVWKDSKLNTVNLNTNFLKNIGSKWASFIDYEDWVIGGNENAKIKDQNPKTVYQNEIVSPVTDPSGAKTYLARVGLMYVSDFLYATQKDDWDTAKIGSDLTDTNWIDEGIDYSHYTITRVSNEVKKVFATHMTTSIVSTDNSIYAKPAFYLIPATTFTGGVGTYLDPYTISLGGNVVKVNLIKANLDREKEVIPANPKTGAALPIVAGILLIAGAFGIRYYTKRKNVINNI